MLQNHISNKPNAALFMPQHIAESVWSKSALCELKNAAELLPVFFEKNTIIHQLPLLQDVEFFFTSWYSPALNEQVLEAAPKLKAVFHCAGSVNSIATEAFWKKSIPITSAQHTNNLPVAEFTYAQIILGLKAYWQNVADFRITKDATKVDSKVAGIYEGEVGIISIGSIARMVAEKMNGLQVNLLGFDPYVSKDESEALGIEKVDLKTLFERSNVVSCHAPLIDDTVGMVNEDLLMRLPQYATFINTSRGKVVDTNGLIKCASQRPDIQFLLDVTDPEPLNSDSPMWKYPNIHVSPHIAGSKGTERFKLGEAMLSEFLRFRSGQQLINEIRRERALLMT